ncbi:MAG TPA: hypothetical protein VGC13_11570 [Longimicrobium sp.]|jgi:hypothetical protein
MSDHVAPQAADAPPRRKPLLDRVNVLVAIFTGLVGCGIGIAGVHLTHTDNTEQKKLGDAQVILQSAKEFGKDDPEVVKPVVRGLRAAGQHDAAETLHAVAEQNARARPKLAPVILPRHRDSAEALLAQLEHQLRKQPAIPRNLVARSDGEPAGEPRIEILPILPGSETAILPGGERVSRSGSGRLMEDRYGNLICVGSGCGGSEGCCRFVIDPH